jgi:glutamate 5-kinase
MADARDIVRGARRVVVKLGTGALTDGQARFNRAHFGALCEDLCLAARERELVVVSSGAVALGVERLGYASRPKDIPGKQACAAVGQSRLMQAYEEALGRAGRVVAQVLLTHDDVQHRRRYLNARHTLQRLLEERVIPIVNENDTTSVAELKFGDNDTLAGLVAGLVEADLLVILSDVEGLFEADPRARPDARRLEVVPEVTPEILALGGESVSGLGVGGMATKLRSAAKVNELGGAVVIASGREPGILGRVLMGEPLGTLFLPKQSRRSARAAWIAHALRPLGKVWVDAGAQAAVTSSHRSLLPSGIRQVEGDFQKGDPVDLVSPEGRPFARGLVAYPSDELRRIAGRRSAEIEQVLGYRYLDEAVHRDDLALLA